MDAETAKEIEDLKARVAELEFVLTDVEDGAIDPVVSQHREFVARVRARREEQE